MKNKEAIKKARDKYRSSEKGKLKEALYNKKWYKNNKIRKRIRSRLSRYKITQTEYDSLMIKQKGKCPICDNFPKPKKNLASLDAFAIDHDHKTGKVRGLLCESCNKALGLLQDSPENCLRASSYLMNNKGDR